MTLRIFPNGEQFPMGIVPITDFVFGKRDFNLYAARATGQIDVWDITKKEKTRELGGLPTTIMSLVDESHQRLLAAGFDRTVRLIDIATGKTVASSGSLQDDIRTMAVDSSGTKAIAVTEHGWVIFLSLPKPERAQET